VLLVQDQKRYQYADRDRYHYDPGHYGVCCRLKAVRPRGRDQGRAKNDNQNCTP
jgi:hypothetical protein